MNRKSKLIVSSRPQTEKPTKSFLFWKVSNMDQPKINSLFCFFLFIHFIFSPKEWNDEQTVTLLSAQCRPDNKMIFDEYNGLMDGNCEENFHHFSIIITSGAKKRSDPTWGWCHRRVCVVTSIRVFQTLLTQIVGLTFGPVHKIQFFPTPKPDMRFRYRTELTSNGRINRWRAGQTVVHLKYSGF